MLLKLPHNALTDSRLTLRSSLDPLEHKESALDRLSSTGLDPVADSWLGRFAMCRVFDGNPHPPQPPSQIQNAASAWGCIIILLKAANFCRDLTEWCVIFTCRPPIYIYMEQSTMLALHSQIHPVASNFSDPYTFLVAPAASDLISLGEFWC
jgi:hypothetical protein